MKKAICIFLIVVITVASVPMAMCSVAAGSGTNTTSFDADFTSASTQWEGTLTDFLGYTGSGTAKTGSYFGTSGGWSNSTGNIITKNSFDFGDKFEAKFSLYTNWGNGERNNFFDDFYINIGKFRIVIADHQTRIELYYNGNHVDGDFSCPNSTYTQIRDYNYTARFEKGKIKITSDIATYTSKFADFDDVDDAKIEINFRETWQIYKDYFHSLSVGTVVENDSTFTADFSNSSTQWGGLRTDSLGYTGSGTTYNGEGTYFGNGDGFVNTQKTGAITTVKNYDFGEEFSLNFKLYTAWANNNTNNVNRDVHIEVGKFKISVCDYQTRIVVSYNGEDITGESVCTDKAYVSPKDVEYNVTIKKGYIKVTGGNLTYNSDFADFAAQDNVKVSVSINETWQIHKIYFSKLSVKASSEIPQNNKSFIADFKKSSVQWQEGGLTKYLGYTGGGNNYSDAGEYFGNGEGWNNSTGVITTVNSYDFGESAEMSFCFWTYYANGNKNNASLDAYIDVGPFRICLCDYQTRIVVKYNGETINGSSVCSNDTYLSPKTQSYNVFIEKGKIEIKSETVKYTSNFDGFDALDNVKVSVGISETWQIYELCFKGLKITGKTETTPVAPKTELSADFSSTYGVEGLTQYIGYGKYGDTYGTDDSTPLQKGTLTFKDTYDFGNKAHLRFKLYTKTNGEFSGEDFSVNVGKFKLAVCNGQNDIKLYYDGTPVSGDTVFKSEDSSTVKSYEYNAYFEKGNIVIESNLVKFTSSFSGFEAINEAKVSITIDNTYTVYKKFYFSDFAVNVEKKAYKNGGNSFYTDFSDKTPFEGKLLSSVDTANNLFPLDKGWKNPTGQIKTTEVYSFGNKYHAWFSLKTVSLNDVYKLDQNGNYRMTDYEVGIGDLTIQSRHFQNGIAISFGGEEIASVYTEKKSYGEKDYTYELSVDGNNVKLVQRKGNKTVLSLECTVPKLYASENVIVQLSVLENWEIYEGYFSNLLIADDSLGITSIEDYIKRLEESKYDWGDSAYGGDTFTSDFSDISLWMDELTEYIKTDKKEFRPKWGWDNKTGKISSAKWYNFTDSLEARFDLYTEYYNDSLHDNPESANLADYRFNIGKFTVEIRHFQHVIALFYEGKLIKSVQRSENSYWQKTYSYVVAIKKGNISIRQTSNGKTVLELNSSFSDFDAVNKARVSIEVVESDNIYVSYVKSISVKPIKIYKVIRSFNAVKDIKKVLSSDDAVVALQKTQWSIAQRYKSAYSAGEWAYDTLSHKLNITGFYESVPITPSPIPVMHINNGAYSTELGVYDGKLLFRGNYDDGHERKSALTFTAPATGKLRIHDPELGLIAVASQLNGMNTWCMNSSDSEVKSIYISIYKNGEKLWPSDSEELLFSNGSHPSSAVPVTNTAFPDLLVDVKQGDVIYFAFRPKHYQKANNYILSNNPTVLTMNPQVDYISVSGDFALNENKEITKEVADNNIAGQIMDKGFGLRDELKEEASARGANLQIIAIVCIIAGGVILLTGTATLVTVLIKRKRRAING